MVATLTPSHPQFTWLFLAVSRADTQDKPHRETITATSEREARAALVGRFILSFAGRLPVQGAHNE